jgi:hypothetical protein
MVPAQREPPPDLAVQPVPLPFRHGQVPGERVQQLDILLRRVDAFPVVLADGGDLEQVIRFDLALGKLTGAQPVRAGRHPLTDLVVDVLDLAEERVPAVGVHVFRRPGSQVAAGPQRLPGPLVADARVDPVPGGRRVHQAERFGRLPLLELVPHHLHIEPGQVPPRHRGQFGAEFHAGDAEAAPGQRTGRLARCASHLEQVIWRCQAGQGDEIIEQGLGVAGTHPVVALSGLVERLPQPLAVCLGMHRVKYATDLTCDPIPASPAAVCDAILDRLERVLPPGML